MKTIQLPAVVVSINVQTLEALVRFNTGESKVVKIDEEFDADALAAMQDGASVQVEFDTEDELSQGKIVYVHTEEPTPDENVVR